MKFPNLQVIYTDADGVPCEREVAVWSVRGNLRTSKTQRPQVLLNGEWVKIKQEDKRP